MSADVKAVIDAWQTAAIRADLPKVRVWTPARVAQLKARLTEVGVDGLLEAIQRIEASSHCTGYNDRGWKADFDFLVAANRLPRILEGRYDNRAPRRSSEDSRNGAAVLLARDAAQGLLLEHQGDD